MSRGIYGEMQAPRPLGRSGAGQARSIAENGCAERTRPHWISSIRGPRTQYDRTGHLVALQVAQVLCDPHPERTIPAVRHTVDAALQHRRSGHSCRGRAFSIWSLSFGIFVPANLLPFIAIEPNSTFRPSPTGLMVDTPRCSVPGSRQPDTPPRCFRLLKEPMSDCHVLRHEARGMDEDPFLSPLSARFCSGYHL